MIGVLIRELREERAITQAHLAGSIGLTTSALVRIERGQARPRLSTLRKLADALLVDVRQLTAALRNSPSESEEEVPPIADLQELGAGEAPTVTLQARDSLQRVAEDILAAVVAGDSQLTGHLVQLESSARRLSGPVAEQGFALAEFLGGIREEGINPQHSPDPAHAAEALKRLISAARSSTSYWEPEYRETCRAYAAILLRGEPRTFHDAVGRFLLQRADLTIEGIGDLEHAKQSAGRRAIMALGTVLSAFDHANGSRGDLATGEDKPKGESTMEEPEEDSSAEVPTRRKVVRASS